MGIKKKLGLGVASAALGLSLIGGGTFAYFNDTATLHNAFASGTLTLNLEKAWDFPINFDLKDIKPGDSWERQFVLANKGSLDIGDTFMAWTADANSDAKLLETLTVKYFVHADPPFVDPGAVDGEGYLLLNSQDITLKEAIDGQFTGKIKSQYLKGGKLNLTPLGIAPGGEDRMRMIIEFPNDENASQNDLQGKMVKVDFKFDARQTDGSSQSQVGPNNANNAGDAVTKP